ncbi:MAG: double zinc ribbon domain-containing protein [Candidatus Portnoybacteria bacterium]|nr:double zinc ribbon domain-containing protein [Candidatus Portnoybacteria bacterium]
MNLFLKKSFRYFIDSIFPKHCLSCGLEGSHVCADCFSKIPIMTSQTCFICGRRSPDMKVCSNCKEKNNFVLDGVLVVSDWRNLLVRQIVYECKYRFVRELAQTMAEIISRFLKNNFPPSWKNNEIFIIPIPLHRRRHVWRGFNQAEIIAKKIAAELSLSMPKNLIQRRRHTSPQADIHNFLARAKNVSGAFAINKKLNPEAIKNKIVVLIDDVSTTGSTLNECALILKKFRPKEIWGLVFARG